jgi:hypothetical protein
MYNDLVTHVTPQCCSDPSEHTVKSYDVELWCGSRCPESSEHTVASYDVEVVLDLSGGELKQVRQKQTTP